ncbi:MAG: YraN family protein [Candidatus Portiera sp.]|nr:YraN family protein [Portiera sp.]
MRGKFAEKQARKFLQSRGLSFITKNFKCQYGEIDLIMGDKNELVFVEVRMRSSRLYGDAAETVDKTKLTKLINSSEYYIQRNYADKQVPNSRMDLVAINGTKFEWIHNIQLN